jgi:hypothetical protein
MRQHIAIITAESRIKDNYINQSESRLLLSELYNKELYPNAVYNYRDGTLFYSYVVNLNENSLEDDLKDLKNLAFKSFNQKSILYADANRNIQRIFKNGKIKDLGQLTLVKKDEAQDNNEYLLSTVSGYEEYFICKQN